MRAQRGKCFNIIKPNFLMDFSRNSARAARKFFEVLKLKLFSQFRLRIAPKVCIGKMQHPGRPKSVCTKGRGPLGYL